MIARVVDAAGCGVSVLMTGPLQAVSVLSIDESGCTDDVYVKLYIKASTPKRRGVEANKAATNVFSMDV